MTLNDKNNSDQYRTLALFATLSALAVVGNYWHMASFGIYEDDYFFTIQAYNWHWTDCWAQIKNALISWPQGRPIGFALTYLVSWLSAQSNSLLPGYTIGACILILNTGILFSIAKKILPILPSFVAASVYCLYPVDGSKVILMHRVFQLLNCTFMLAGLLFYMRGRSFIAYASATLCLLTYESFFFPFLLAPLLVQNFQNIKWIKFFIHLFICVFIIGVILLVRKSIGDTRVTETFNSWHDVSFRILNSLWIGPRIALKESFLRIAEAFYFSDLFQWTLMIVITFVILKLNLPATQYPLTCKVKAQQINRGHLWIPILGLVFMASGYLMAFRADNYPPVVTIGRLSAFNTPGSFGAAIFSGGLCSLAFTVLKQHSKLLYITTGLLIGSMASYGLEVQRTEYARQWEQQKQFFRPLLETSGEWGPNISIIVNIEGHEQTIATPGFPAFWAINSTPMLAPYVFQYPTEWTSGSTPAVDARHSLPRIYGYYEGMAVTTTDTQQLLLHAPPWADETLWPRLEDGNFIYFIFEKGHLHRTSEPIKLAGRWITPKPSQETSSKPLATTKLYRTLFDQPTSSWPSFKRALNYPH